MSLNWDSVGGRRGPFFCLALGLMRVWAHHWGLWFVSVVHVVFEEVSGVSEEVQGEVENLILNT